MNSNTDQPNGIFPELFGKRAFFDVLSVGVEGIRRTRLGSAVNLGPSIAIGGEGKPYARSRRGLCVASGNPVELRVGPNPLFRNLDPYSVRVRSNASPLRADAVKETLSALFRNGYQARPLSAELTFDIGNTSVIELRDQLLSSLRSERQVAAGQTFYAGSPNSPVGIRIYRKAVTRAEILLRSGFFRMGNILTVDGLGELRDYDFSRLLRFCTRNDGRVLMSELRNVPDGQRKKLLFDWPSGRPLRLWVSALRVAKIDPERCLTNSAIQRQIKRMQKGLIW